MWMIRKTRKITKLRGSRTCGGGCSKKRRGAGHRGGRGNAGSGKEKKQKSTWFQIHKLGHIGRHGFQRGEFLRSDQTGINVSAIEQHLAALTEEGCVEYDGTTPVIDVSQVGIQKVLGSGRLSKPMVIKAPMFSKNAKAKIEEAGGEAITL